MDVSDKEFEKLIGEAIDNIPELYRNRIENVAFILEAEPTPQQRQKLNLYPNESLYGLYEGVPLPLRGGHLKLIPDKITLFKNPLLSASTNMGSLRRNIGHTVWHEVAHYFGLDHKRIHELETKFSA